MSNAENVQIVTAGLAHVHTISDGVPAITVTVSTPVSSFVICREVRGTVNKQLRKSHLLNNDSIRSTQFHRACILFPS